MKKVITSKEQGAYLMAWEKYRDKAEIEEKADNIIWTFPTDDEAYRAAQLFFHLCFEYVQKK